MRRRGRTPIITLTTRQNGVTTIDTNTTIVLKRRKEVEVHMTAQNYSCCTIYNRKEEEQLTII